MSLDNFIHIYKSSQAKKTLVLLHGTGADEYDLLPLINNVDGYNILSLRGNIREQGMNRFFARSAPGVFDEASIRTEADKLATFIQTFTTDQNQSAQDLVFLGYSNGANMILALVMLHPKQVHRAILLHPMLPLDASEGLSNLVGKHFLVSYGEQDQMISANQSKRVIAYLNQAGAMIAQSVHPGGHEIRPQEVQAIHQFLEDE